MKVEDLRNQLNRMEQERARVKLQMEEKRYEEELRERRKRRTGTNVRWGKVMQVDL